MGESPAPTPAVDNDALSEILNTIRLRGEHVYRSSASAGDSIVQPDVPLLHVLESGSATLTDGLEINGGDLLLVPRGVPHSFVVTTDLRWMTGTIGYEPSAASARLLTTLPPIIRLRFEPDDPREWLQVSSRLMLQEVTDPLPGGSVMVSRIIDLLFVQTLRAWSRESAQDAGWLRAAMDPSIGPVVAALHREPGVPWTVASMAAIVHLSRTTFSGRFAELAGQPPLHYLTERRLEHAQELLTATELQVRAISVRCGYTSEAAFSRAFTRHYGVSPRRFRQGVRGRPEDDEVVPSTSG